MCCFVCFGGVYVFVVEFVFGDEVFVVCDRVVRYIGVVVEEDVWFEC